MCPLLRDDVRGATPSGAGGNRRLRFLMLALVALVLGYLVWTLVTIQLRLSRNLAIARELAESLRARFPGLEFRGGASYEVERIYITAHERIDAAIRGEVEQWLRREKAERGMSQDIWLRFVGDNLEDIKF